MKDICFAWKILLDGQSAPIGYQKIPCHIVFGIKMEDFWCKARLDAGGHMTKAPTTITDASAVSRETIHIALVMASINDLNVKVGDVHNASITAPITEKVLDLNLAMMPERVPSLCMSYKDWSVLVLRSAYTFHPCALWGTCLAKQTLTYSLRLRLGLMTTFGIMPTYVDDILCVHHILWLYLTWSMDTSPPHNATFWAIWRETKNWQKNFPPTRTQLFNSH